MCIIKGQVLLTSNKERGKKNPKTLKALNTRPLALVSLIVPAVRCHRAAMKSVWLRSAHVTPAQRRIGRFWIPRIF